MLAENVQQVRILQRFGCLSVGNADNRRRVCLLVVECLLPAACPVGKPRLTFSSMEESQVEVKQNEQQSTLWFHPHSTNEIHCNTKQNGVT